MKIKITFTLDEQQANWLLSAIEKVLDPIGDSDAPEVKFLRRVMRTIERRLTQRAPDVCPVCGGSEEPFATLFGTDVACPACDGQRR